MARNGKAGKGKSAKSAKHHKKNLIPPVLVPEADAKVLETSHGSFDLEDPVLPDWVEKRALTSGGYPYDDTIKDHVYEEELALLQIELVKLQRYINQSGARLVVLFEGRDAAGKGGCIFAMRQYMNPRSARVVALPKPTEAEAGQWYFQRYAEHLPTAGELVLYDRSWYNRAGVERVMGFCTDEQYDEFFRSVPEFERMLVRSGIRLVKYWFSISDEEQHLRFLARIYDPLKQWKLSPMDLESRRRWEDYTRAKEVMIERTHIREAPWWVVAGDDKKKARLNCIAHLLSLVPYHEIDHPTVKLPERVRHKDYTRRPTPKSMVIPERY